MKVFLAFLLGIVGIWFFWNQSRDTSTLHSDLFENCSFEETTTMDESTSPDYWLNSGAMFACDGGSGQTAQGRIRNKRWIDHYNSYNTESTDGGYYPQNILRLITKKTFADTSQFLRFRIDKHNFPDAEKRNESNGVLLLSRYQDEDHLYYGGLRVDGDVVIKKKYAGSYTTLAQEPFYQRGYEYSEDKKESFIPENTWIDMRFETKDTEAGVELTLWVKREGVWNLVLSTLDDGSQSPVLGSAHSGIRSDFMDLSLDKYEITNP